MSDEDEHLQIAIPLFDQFTALDAVGPYEVLQRIPTFDVTFVGHERGEVRSENRMLGLVHRCHLRGAACARRDRVPGRRRDPGTPTRRAVLDLAAYRTQGHPLHHIGVHRVPRARAPPGCSRA